MPISIKSMSHLCLKKILDIFLSFIVMYILPAILSGGKKTPTDPHKYKKWTNDLFKIISNYPSIVKYE